MMGTYMTQQANFQSSLKRAYIYLFLGPIFVFLTTALSYQNKLDERIFLLAAFGLSVIWVFPKHGFKVVSATLILYAAYLHVSTQPMVGWYLGLYIALFISLFISYLGAQEFQGFLNTVPSRVTALEEEQKTVEDLRGLCSCLQQELLQAGDQKTSLEDAHASLGILYEDLETTCAKQAQDLAGQEGARKKFAEQVEQFQAKTAGLEEALSQQKTLVQEKQEELMDFALKIEKGSKEKRLLEERIQQIEALLNKERSKRPEDTPTMNVSLRKELRELQQAFSEKSEDFQLVTLHYNELKKFEPMYFQLKKQFAEKNGNLDEARMKLFHAEETITRLKKKREEEKCFLDEESEKLVGDLASLTAELSARDEEEQELYLLIDALNKKLLS
ncbi:MAG: hypothetical protein AAGI90_03195 [Chlamydiota bacterium]